MYKLLVLLSGLILLLNTGHTQPVKVLAKPQLQVDSTKVRVRPFDNAALQRYANQKDFDYNEQAPGGISWWTRFWRWIWQFLNKMLSGVRAKDSTWFLFKAMLFILATAFIVFVVAKILGADIIKLFRSESKKVDLTYAESLENIHEINFDAEIENAIANRNYRFAVRLLYLRCLKQLNDAQLIHWQIDKTNSAYVNELQDTEQRQMFGLLTRQFEYIWYGDFQVDGQGFQNINALFTDFKRALQ